ncbi:MAG: hypothetical protein ACI8T1_002439 [Verrucomicrobiales bacterium]|jgi:hypothetical protein
MMHQNCQGMGRRDFLQLGMHGLAGLGLADLLRLRAEATANTGMASDTRCILVWLDGGPTHHESFDPKPDAPSEIRGDFKPISTNVPGIQFSESVPKLAAIANKLSVIRSICHKDPNHGGGNHYMMTGAPTPVPVSCGAFVTFHPSFGSVVSHHRGVQKGMPAYMTLPRQSRSGGPNFLGAEHAPLVVDGNPNSKSFRVRDVVLPKSISEGRAQRRRDLRSSLDRLTRFRDQQANDPALAFDSYYDQGLELVTSKAAQAAFDIHQEPEAVRERYGRNDFGQRLLLARRLVEVGVPFVTVYHGGWDHHTVIFDSLKKKMPAVDQGLATLISDLDDRGLSDNTLVIMLGEFGRTPKINKDGGRDHWPHAMSVLMAGAGIPGGQVIGATDRNGAYASDNIHSPEDFAASLYTKMGIDPHQIFHNSAGRPVPLVNGGSSISELFA